MTLDPGIAVAVVTAIAALIAALSGRRKTDAEIAKSDAEMRRVANEAALSLIKPLKEQIAGVKNVTGGAYWTYENEVAGAGGYYLDGDIDGVIGLMAFGCGPDSLLMDMVRRYSVETKSAPFMCLTLEEHTAEAGIVTRLEAFTDMIYRKKKAETKACVLESLI